MKVELLVKTPYSLVVLWTTAKTCKSDDVPTEIWDKAWQDEIRSDAPFAQNRWQEKIQLLRNLWHAGHHSVFEHVTLTYGVSGVSRTLLAQYSRHRIGVSLSVQSQRAGKFGGFVMPDSFRKAPAPLLGKVRHYLAEGNDLYDDLVDNYIPKEDARFILTGGASLNFVTTVNLRSLADLWAKRVVAPGAQWEIRQMVQTMVDEAKGAMPWLSEVGWCEGVEKGGVDHA